MVKRIVQMALMKLLKYVHRAKFPNASQMNITAWAQKCVYR